MQRKSILVRRNVAFLRSCHCANYWAGPIDARHGRQVGPVLRTSAGVFARGTFP